MTNKEKSQLQKEIVDSLPLYPHGRLILAPRCGKTKIAIDLIKKNHFSSILWVTPSSELAVKDIPEEFVKWKAKRYLKVLSTVTYASLSKAKGQYDAIILDEEQHLTEANSVNLLNGELDYGCIISMTGSKTAHQEKKDLYKKLGLKILYNISINDAVDIGLLSNYTINVVEIPMSDKKDVEAGRKDNRFLTSERSNYSYLDRMADQAMYQKRNDTKYRILARMRAIKNSKSKDRVAYFLFNELKKRVLMFCSSIDQADRLSSLRYHSKTDNTALLAFKEGTVDKITMVNAGGTGFTYKEIDHLILVQADSDKNGLTTQKIC